MSSHRLRSASPSRCAPTVAVHELLFASPRGLVYFVVASSLRELIPELIVNRLGTVPHNRKTTAAVRSFKTERRHDDVPTWLQRVTNVRHVSLAIFFPGEEVEDRAVMPEFVAVLR